MYMLTTISNLWRRYYYTTVAKSQAVCLEHRRQLFSVRGWGLFVIQCAFSLLVIQCAFDLGLLWNVVILNHRNIKNIGFKMVVNYSSIEIQNT